MAVRAGCCCSTYFNPRPPRGERLGEKGGVHNGIQFQSTPSARRATRRPGKITVDRQNFNPRPPRGERLSARRWREARISISIHALREESDAAVLHLLRSMTRFQSTPSARRATRLTVPDCLLLLYFNPRPPRGERRKDFQQDFHAFFISIHALREESDSATSFVVCPFTYFNPRPPRGERRPTPTKHSYTP